MQPLHPKIEAMLKRRSIRRYAARPVEQAVLNQILLAGINAPSAHDSRPWKVVAVTSPAGKQRLTAALSSRFQKDMEAAGFSPQEVERRLSRSRSIFASAPVLVVLFARQSLPDNPLAKTKKTEELLTVQSVALAAGQMLLAASHLGLAGCWFAAPLFCPGEVCAACELDETLWAPQCLLTLGYPAEQPKEKAPPQLEDSVIWL
jgi:F420 biosynthesis protein FbiB-like protein